MNSNHLALYRRELRTAIGGAILLILSILAGCGTNDDPIRSDAVRYSESLSSLAGLEVAAGEALRSVIGENFTDDETVDAIVVNLVVPKYQEFLDGLDKITPETEEIAEIHQIFIKGAKEQMVGFILLKTSVNEGAKKLATARITMQDALKALRELVEGSRTVGTPLESG